MDKSLDFLALMASINLADLQQRWDLSTILVTAFAILTTLLFTQAIYNLYLHPLRHFPGPRLHALSKLPQFLVRLTGLDPFFHLAQHQQHGDIVRVGPDALSFAHPHAWRDIYARVYDADGASGARKAIARHERMYTPWRREKSVFNANGATHARQRKVLAPAFAERAVREYEPVLRKYVGLLVRRLAWSGDDGADAAASSSSSSSSMSFDMANMYQSTTLDIMADICGREPTRYLEDAKVHGGWRLEVEQKLYHLMMSLRTFSVLTWLLVRAVVLPIYWLADEDQRFDAQAVKQRYDHADNSDQPSKMAPDMWKFAQKDENGAIAMEQEEMVMNVKLLMFAGSETTANLLTGTTWFLLRNPEKLTKLTTMLRSMFNNAEEMTMTSLVKVDYLNACLREGLRMHPPAPSNMLRKVPPGGAIICGQHIPGGTEVSAASYAMDHWDKYWHNPWDYEPERWMGEEQYEGDAREAFQPFAMGAQNCLGMTLAWHEARLILANVVYHYELALDSQTKKWTEQRGLVVWEKTPLLVKVLPRKARSDISSLP